MAIRRIRKARKAPWPNTLRITTKSGQYLCSIPNDYHPDVLKDVLKRFAEESGIKASDIVATPERLRVPRRRDL